MSEEREYPTRRRTSEDRAEKYGSPWGGPKTKGPKLAARINEVERWLRRGPILKSALHQRIRELWGVDWRMADYYIARAKDRLLLHLGEAREEHRAASLAFYEGMIMSKKATYLERIRARERIDKLLGLEQPQQIQAEITSRPSGVPIDELSLDLDSKKKLLKAIRDKKETIPHSNGNPIPVEEEDDWETDRK